MTRNIRHLHPTSYNCTAEWLPISPLFYYFYAVFILCIRIKVHCKTIVEFTILSAYLINIDVGSAPGVSINIKGVTQFELSKDAAKSNGGGSTYLLSKIDSSKNKCKTSLYIFFYK